MKTTIFLAMFCFLWINVIAQAPQSFKYQAVVRDNAGAIMPNKAVFFKISILSGSSTGSVVYREIHSGTSTNAFGLVDLEIGKGASELGTFSAINWGSGSYFIKVEIFPNGATGWQEMGTTQLLSVPYALYAKDVQNKDDADADPSNEIQSLSVTGNNLSLSKGGGTVAIPGDNWGTQVAKTNVTLTGQGTDASPLGVVNSEIKPSWGNVQSIPAGFADGVDNVNDADTSITNEIQTLSLSGTQLTLSKNGGTVTLPSSGGGDNWGTDVVKTDATLAGNGTTANSLKIADYGVTSAKIADNSIQTADLMDNAITSIKIANGAVTTDKLAVNAITTEKVNAGAVTGAKIAQAGATAGQALKWNGTTWVPADDVTGGVGFTLPYSGSISTDGNAFSVTNELSTAISGKATSESGLAYGIYGKSESAAGGGIYGINSSKSGRTFGVIGETASPDGVGVYGKTSATGGAPVGVWGEANVFGGIGVYATGGHYGLYTEQTSSQGCAVSGISTSTTGNTFGVWGYSGSSTGVGVEGKSPYIGVIGESTGREGITYGVKGISASNNGSGVYGETSFLDGIAYGVKGISTSYSGYGVYGEASNIGVYGKGHTNGLFAETDYNNSWGVFGQNTSTTGDGIGVKGYSASNTGEGVEGQCPWIGVKGRGTGIFGIGVIGQATSSSGTTYGVIGGVSSTSGFSGYFSGGKFYVGGNTGIGTESPSAKLHLVYNSTMDLPQLLLDENDADYARLMFKNSDAPTKNWTIAGATSSTDANSKLNFYYSALGDIVSISGDGKVGIRTNAPAFTLEVNGTAGKTGGGSWSTSSDIRLKNILGNYSRGLNEIMALQPIIFTYKEGNPRNLPSNQEQVGFVAQEVQKIFPEAVNEGKDGYLDFNIHSINVAMVNAIKELKAENNRLKAENEQVISRIEKLEKLMGISSMK